MSVEDTLEDYARRAMSLKNVANTATDHEARQHNQDRQSTLYMDAEGLIARNPRAFKAKALMVRNEDWIQNPPSASASFVRSLLRDLLLWEP